MSEDDLPQAEPSIVITYDDDGPYKKKRKKAIPWMKMFNLPPEIIDLIFTYLGVVGYWTYRIFREFVRFREYLDPRYMVQTNMGKHILMFNIPPGQKKEDHFFTNSEEFIKNFETHCKIYNIEKSNVFLFMEIEVSRIEQGQMFEKIINFLKENNVRFRIFLRAILFFDHICPISDSLTSDLATDEFLAGNELILDAHYAKELTTHSYSRFRKYTGCKFAQYPEEINVKNGYNSLQSKYLDLNNVINKGTVRNLTKATITGIPHFMLTVDDRVLQNLTSLKLNDCSKGSKRTLFIHMNLPYLKELALYECQTAKFSDNDLPNLETLMIREPSYNGDRSGVTFKLIMNGNSLPNIKNFEICTKKIEQIHLNTFGEKLDKFQLQAALEEGGSLGDIPNIVSISELVILKATYHDTLMVKKVFDNVHNPEKIKKLLIYDNFTTDLAYLQSKRFKNLEILNLRELNNLNFELPSLNMPLLKSLSVLETSIETVDIKRMAKLESMIFTSKSRTNKGHEFDEHSWRWFSTPKEYFVIDFTKIPTKSKVKNVNLNYHKADSYRNRIPQEFDNFVIKYNPLIRSSYSGYDES